MKKTWLTISIASVVAVVIFVSDLTITDVSSAKFETKRKKTKDLPVAQREE